VYLGNLEHHGENYIVIPGLVTALSPIAHGEPPKREGAPKDNNRPVRRMAVCAGGSFVDLPVVSSIHCAHLFRTLLVRDALGKAGVAEGQLRRLSKDYPELYQVLFNGGTLEKKDKNGGAGAEAAEEAADAEKGSTGKNRAGEAKKAKEARKAALRQVPGFGRPETFTDLFYAVKLLGGSVTWLDDVMIESLVGVDHMWPLTAEVALIRGLSAAQLKERYGAADPLFPAALLNRVEPMVLARTDDTARGRRAEGEEDARMIYRVEYIPAGTRFLHDLRVTLSGDDGDVRLALSALRYLAETLLPAHPFVGGLVKRGFGHVEFRYRVPEKWNDAAADPADYADYVEARKGKIKEAIDSLVPPGAAAGSETAEAEEVAKATA
jgi:hypothetical protein